MLGIIFICVASYMLLTGSVPIKRFGFHFEWYGGSSIAARLSGALLLTARFLPGKMGSTTLSMTLLIGGVIALVVAIVMEFQEPFR